MINIHHDLLKYLMYLPALVVIVLTFWSGIVKGGE